MSSFWSRILISAAGIPLVLWILYLGGWPLFALALVAALFGLHELYWMTRALRPVVPRRLSRRHRRRCWARSSAEPDWALAGLFMTLAFAFVFKGSPSSSTRLGRADGARRRLDRPRPRARAAAAGHRRARGPGGLHRHARGLGRRRGARTSSGCSSAGTSLRRRSLLARPGKGSSAGTVATIGVTFVTLYKQDFLSIPESLALGAVIAFAAPLGDLFESAFKRDMEVKDSGRLLGGPRRRAGPDGRAALRLGRRVLRDRCLRAGLICLHFQV